MSAPARGPGEELSVAIVCGQQPIGQTDPAPSVGGESAALVCALACHAAGFSQITVYVNTALSNPAASVELSPNASRILRTLKVLEPLRERCFEPQFVHQRSFRTGFQLSIQALGAMAEGRYNAPFLHVRAGALCAVLAELATARGIEIIASPILTLSQNSTSVSLALNEPAVDARTHDVLIVAADPVDQLREHSNADALVYEPTPYVHWQGQLRQEELPEGAFGPVVTQWLGPAHHLSYHYDYASSSQEEAQEEAQEETQDGAQGDAQAKYLQISAISALPTEPTASEPSLEQLVSQLQSWHPSLRALLSATKNLAGHPVKQTQPPERLAHGRILFLGSSCHRILPHLPQQCALGIEDAWVCARMLEQWEDEPTSGWVEYEKYRLPRARRVQTQAQRLAEHLCLQSSGKAWQRNLALTFGSRFLPELAMQKNDWLYGYDAVNGFE